jgi:hypothetical protein
VTTDSVMESHLQCPELAQARNQRADGHTWPKVSTYFHTQTINLAEQRSRGSSVNHLA